jgi:CysZ protein
MSTNSGGSFHESRKGFSAGVEAAMRGLRIAGRSAEVRGTYARLVAAIFVLAACFDVGGVWAVWHFTAVDPSTSWWMIAVLWTLRIAGVVIVLLVAPLVAFFVINALFPFLAERVFFAALRAVAPARAQELEAMPGKSVLRGLADNLLRMGLFFATTLLAFGVSLVPAVGAIAGPPISVYFTARAMGWELLDPYFDKLQLDFAAQREFVARHRPALVGFGLPLGFVMAIPLVGPLFFGLAQAAAAVFVADVIERPSSAEPPSA